MSDKQKLPEPSPEFEMAVGHAGTASILCELCGRTNFCEGDWQHFEEGELEKLRQNAEEKPDEYFEHVDCDSISWGTIDGKQAVIGCPCNKLYLYEKLLWNSRYIIADYFGAVAEKLKKETQQVEEIAQKTSKAIK